MDKGKNPPLFEGYLQKKADKALFGVHQWHKRYFLLQQELLCYFESQEAREENVLKPKGTIKLCDIKDIELSSSHDGCRMDVEVEGKTIGLLAESPVVCKQWYEALTQAKERFTRPASPSMELSGSGVNVTDDARRPPPLITVSGPSSSTGSGTPRTGPTPHTPNTPSPTEDIKVHDEWKADDDDQDGAWGKSQNLAMGCIKEGPLKLKASNRDHWKKRYFLLTSTVFKYYESPDISLEANNIPLYADTVVHPYFDKLFRYSFIITRGLPISVKLRGGSPKGSSMLPSKSVMGSRSFAPSQVVQPKDSKLLPNSFSKLPHARSSMAAGATTGSQSLSTSGPSKGSGKKSTTLGVGTSPKEGKDITSRKSEMLTSPSVGLGHSSSVMGHYNPRVSAPAAITSDGKVIEATVTYCHHVRAASREDMEEWVALLQYQISVLGDPSKVGEEFSCMTLPSGAHTISADMQRMGFSKTQGLEALISCQRVIDGAQNSKKQRKSSITIHPLSLSLAVLWLVKNDPSSLTPTSAKKYDRESLKEGWLIKKKRKKESHLFERSEWAKRFFVLKSTSPLLEFYKQPTDHKPAGKVLLTSHTEVELYDSDQDEEGDVHHKPKDQMWRFIISTYDDAASRTKGIEHKEKFRSIIRRSHSQQRLTKHRRSIGHKTSFAEEDIKEDSKNEKEESQKSDVDEEDENTLIVSTNSESDRKAWLVTLWRLITELAREEEELKKKRKRAEDGKNSSSNTRDMIFNAQGATVDHSATASTALLKSKGAKFNFTSIEEGRKMVERLEAEDRNSPDRSIYNFIKNKHKVLTLFYVHQSKGLPRHARVYLFFFDIALNLFMTLLFLYLATLYTFAPVVQVLTNALTLLVVGIFMRWMLSSIYEDEDLCSKCSRLVSAMIIPMCFLGGGIVFCGFKLGAYNADSKIITRFALSSGISWFTEVGVLVVQYYLFKNYCTFIPLDDRLVANDDLQAAKDALKKIEKDLKKHEERSIEIRVGNAHRDQEMEKKKGKWMSKILENQKKKEAADKMKKQKTHISARDLEL